MLQNLEKPDLCPLAFDFCNDAYELDAVRLARCLGSLGLAQFCLEFRDALLQFGDPAHVVNVSEVIRRRIEGAHSFLTLRGDIVPIDQVGISEAVTAEDQIVFPLGMQLDIRPKGVVAFDAQNPWSIAREIHATKDRAFGSFDVNFQKMNRAPAMRIAYAG